MLVSHDRALLREVCDEFWLVTKGQLTDFDGDLYDYQRWLLDQSREAARALKKGNTIEAKLTAGGAPAPVAPPVQEARRSSGDRKADAAARQKLADQAKPLKAELKKVEARMASASTEREAALAALAGANQSPAERAEAGRRLKQLDDEIAALELRWLELGEAIEQISAS
jgi:ATP-binding cassette subfamily F protein 3